MKIYMDKPNSNAWAVFTECCEVRVKLDLAGISSLLGQKFR